MLPNETKSIFHLGGNASLMVACPECLRGVPPIYSKNMQMRNREDNKKWKETNWPTGREEETERQIRLGKRTDEEKEIEFHIPGISRKEGKAMQWSTKNIQAGQAFRLFYTSLGENNTP